MDPPGAAVDGVEETGVQAAVGIAGQVNHHGHGLVGRGHPRGSPDVFVRADRLHATDPSGTLLSDRQRQRLDRYLPVGDPHGEVDPTTSVRAGGPDNT